MSTPITEHFLPTCPSDFYRISPPANVILVLILLLMLTYTKYGRR